MFLFALGFGIFITHITIVIHLNIFFCHKMNIKTNLLEEYINLVEKTKKQSKNFKMLLFLNVHFVALFLFFISFEYLNE